ncbi:hypothetical protein [Actinoplanes sp. NPDC051859]|uniref:hypothetical protein n=1 Tax=Actinoplanes sp. NPDC051859 TaxID=3363909 RepID=UPI00378F3BDC
MGITHLVVVTATLLALLFLPCAVAIVACADGLTGRLHGRAARQEARALRRLDRLLSSGGPPVSSGGPPVPPTPCGPSVAELEADLRRLSRQRGGGPTVQSTVWLDAVVRAYDRRLLLASEAFGLPQHLTTLDGMDRELERIRVEEKLRAAGMRLR